ncbi:hypothetical protein B0H14DRAFT_2585849 [Mycena olivaceomarginata]|nr:hypothetical protein B0H14DRAFT_2585849 [Mycena olivaceomarginata]
MATGGTPSAAIYFTSSAPLRQAHHFPLRRHFRTPSPGPLLPHLFVLPPPGLFVPSPPPPPGLLVLLLLPPPATSGSRPPLPLPKPTTNLAENIWIVCATTAATAQADSKDKERARPHQGAHHPHDHLRQNLLCIGRCMTLTKKSSKGNNDLPLMKSRSAFKRFLSRYLVEGTEGSGGGRMEGSMNGLDIRGLHGRAEYLV